MLNRNTELRKHLELATNSIDELGEQLRKLENRKLTRESEMAGIGRKIQELQESIEMFAQEIVDLDEQITRTRTGIDEMTEIRDMVASRLGVTDTRPTLIVLEGEKSA